MIFFSQIPTFYESSPTLSIYTFTDCVQGHLSDFIVFEIS